jgi:ferritin-like metal-binding protein YciE
MGLFTNLKFDSLEDLFHEQLRDLYDAEHRLTEALPKMVDAAHNPELKQAFDQHLTETRAQVRRLEQVFKLVGAEPRRSTCEAMKGLVAEGDEVLSAKGDPAVIDAALIAAAQRVEHYEIAGYGTVRSLAHRLGHHQAADLLQETLDEEGNADKILTEVAEQSVNVEAQHA